MYSRKLTRRSLLALAAGLALFAVSPQVADAKRKPKPPSLDNATLLLALTGWMDGGDVSTGSVRAVMGRREVRQVARIEPDDGGGG